MENYLTRKEAASYLCEHGLRVSANTIQKYATIGGGPIYRIFGGRCLYTMDDLISWVESRISEPRKHTSEAA